MIGHVAYGVYLVCLTAFAVDHYRGYLPGGRFSSTEEGATNE